MIEREREAAHGGPEAEAKLWLDKLAEVGCKRVRYQEMATEDLLGFAELWARMAPDPSDPDGSLEVGAGMF